MGLDIRELLRTDTYNSISMSKALDPNHPRPFVFDPELGYVPADYMGRDGFDGSYTKYTFEPTGQRKMINYADQPCRINAYGNSYTMSQQSSDGETWEEILAAHIREPIRNFGVGGYGVYTAYRRAMRIEADPELAAEYVILYIWGNDHTRSLFPARWIHSAWNQRKRYPPSDDSRPIHGFPWAHVQYDLDKGTFVEKPGVCKTTDDLAKLTDPDHVYELFKDDDIVHLYTLANGGEAPIDHLERVAEALNIEVDLRDDQKRQEDADRLLYLYGTKASAYILDKMRPWAEANGRKLAVILGYGMSSTLRDMKSGVRRDQEFVDYLKQHNMTVIDHLPLAIEEHKAYAVSQDAYKYRFYVKATDAAVYSHFTPYANHRFAFHIKNAIVNWLDPKPPAYRGESSID